MTENNEPSKSRTRTTVPEGSIDIHEYIDGKNFVPEPNIKTEVGQKGVIRATCISKRKGTRKEPIPEGVEVVAHFGVKNDAHASSDCIAKSHFLPGNPLSAPRLWDSM